MYLLYHRYQKTSLRKQDKKIVTRKVFAVIQAQLETFFLLLPRTYPQSQWVQA